MNIKMEFKRSHHMKRNYWCPKGIKKVGSIFKLDPKELIFSDSDELNKPEFVNYKFIFNKESEEKNFTNLINWLRNHGKEFDIIEYENWILFNNFGDSRTLYRFLYNKKYRKALELGLEPLNIPKRFTNNFRIKQELITKLIKKQIKNKKIRIDENGNFVTYDPTDRTIILESDLVDIIGKESVLLSELKQFKSDDSEINSLVEFYWRSNMAKYCIPKILEYISFLADKNEISDKSLKRQLMTSLLELPINHSLPLTALVSMQPYTSSAPPSPKRSISDPQVSPRVMVNGISLGRKLIFN